MAQAVYIAKIQKKNYFSYDRAPYAAQGGIEYRYADKRDWDVFWRDFSAFKEFAEKEIRENVLGMEQEKCIE